MSRRRAFNRGAVQRYNSPKQVCLREFDHEIEDATRTPPLPRERARRRKGNACELCSGATEKCNRFCSGCAAANCGRTEGGRAVRTTMEFCQQRDCCASVDLADLDASSSDFEWAEKTDRGSAALLRASLGSDDGFSAEAEEEAPVMIDPYNPPLPPPERGLGRVAAEYTMEEVAQHNRLDDCWVVLNGKVYDLTEYAQFHPGGTHALERWAGTDASENIHFHSSKMLKLASRYVIGTVEGSGTQCSIM